MIGRAAAICFGVFLAASCSAAVAAENDCGSEPCAGGPWLSLAGNWRFQSAIAQWSVAVDEDGRFHAEGPRSVTIGGEKASYVSTLSGTISHDHVALSIKADQFSLPNFVPGPATICTGVPAGPGRYEGSCANGKQRLAFAFIREGAAAP
ncbi:hypothetical protein SAMN02745157_4877 [Kaistia soli DSM 19436]|uniref:Uncharacterized protein n=1 Tax=Kaistia soli DSM 19436 TaxID=1122133 RepID=A0A1M5N0S0_9HYPH|nr:hypothetical protein [Kaistia soli]SHG82769.1 hypothetical protein SAMN02745157_4877 [Kaistia soli DSM 19436]